MNIIFILLTLEAKSSISDILLFFIISTTLFLIEKKIIPDHLKGKKIMITRDDAFTLLKNQTDYSICKCMTYCISYFFP